MALSQRPGNPKGRIANQPAMMSFPSVSISVHQWLNMKMILTPVRRCMQRLHLSRQAAKEEMGYAPISNLRINTLLSFVLSVSSVVKPSSFVVLVYFVVNPSSILLARHEPSCSRCQTKPFCSKVRPTRSLHPWTNPQVA